MASVGIYDEDTDNYKHFCTGSIVNRKFVLTAAHCMDGSRLPTFEGKTVLLIGTSNLATRRVGEHTIIEIKRNFTHPKYNPRKFIYILLHIKLNYVTILFISIFSFSLCLL